MKGKIEFMNQYIRTLAIFSYIAFGAIGTLFASQGTVIGWMKPSDAWQDQVYLENDAGKERLNLRLFSARAEANVRLANGKKAAFWRCGSGYGLMKDQWLHVAFVWKADGTGRLYVNGKPYDPTTLYGDQQQPLEGEQLADAVKFRKLPKTARDFRLEGRAWSAKEALADYFKACPVDLVMDDAFITAGEAASATWILAPFGALTRPVIAEGYDAGPATVEIATRIQRVGKKGVEPDILAETPFARYEVTKPIALRTVPRAWEPGYYRMAVTIRRAGAADGTVRSLFFRAIAPIRLDFANASDAPWRKTRTLFEKTYAAPGDIRWSSGDIRTASDASGAYLEAGGDVGNRFADILSMDASSIGRPCLLEIEWPDDKPRQMGLYMYEITNASCRDHLQGGLVTGDEIPNTMTRQVRRYLYVPTGTNALFEARTFVQGRPAAVAKVTLSQLAEPLPVLRIRRPACGKGRSFGHCDEDQTFDNNIGTAIMGAPADEILRNLVSYFGYTGQNAFSYSVIRYAADYGAIDGSVKIPSCWPREQGAWKGVIRTLRANGIDFLAQSTMGNVPAFGYHNCLDDSIEERGLVLRNPDGSLVKGLAKRHCRPDLTRPETHAMIADGVTPTLAYALANGAESVSLDVQGDIFSNWTFPSATLGPTNLALRTAITTAAFKTTLDALKSAAPGGTVRVIASPTEENRTKLGIDVDRLAALGGIEFANMRGNTDYYFARFNGKTRAATDNLDRLYDPEAPELRKLASLSAGGSLPLAMVYPQYFETFVHPLGDDKRFQNYFQNADIKPHGRWYLKEPAYCLAKADALRFVIGAQPLGSLGNEDETREFCRAYCALPQRPFTTVPGCDDPVVARWFAAPEGTYVYVVNYCHLPVEAALKDVGAEDLSTGAKVGLARIALKPFELRSFLVAPEAKLDAKALVLSLVAYDAKAFDARRAELRPVFAKLRAGGLDCAAGEASFAKAEAALAAGRLAAAHYWFYHRTVQAAVEDFAQYDELVAERAMHEAGRWAVNGGCNYFTRIGDRLFSPDREWDGRTYGYYGEAPRAVAREKEFCDPASPELELFATERFDISGYKFRLPKGRYHVKIYAKWAYPHAFREEGRLVATYALNGRAIADVDWYRDAKGDIRKTFALEDDVDVEDVLDIGMTSAKTLGACIVNGIEISRR